MSVQKQKLADLVLQKMKQKKEAEERNRPHFEILQLDVTFSLEENNALKQQITELTQRVSNQTELLRELQQRLQELENTGKQKYPVIIVKPEFIASENVPIGLKQFYRKASNTFLKADIIKTQKHDVYLQKQKQIVEKIQHISQLQIIRHQQSIKNINKMRQKRTKVLKQDVKRRLMIQEQNNIQNQIAKLKEENKPLLREYEIKKENLQNRIQYNQQLTVKIINQKKSIEIKYNPVSYREYLKKVFDVRIKNEYMEKNLITVISKLNQTKQLSEKYRGELQKKGSINFLGKTSDSPSTHKGRIQKTLMHEREMRSSTNPKSINEIINANTENQVRRKSLLSTKRITDNNEQENDQNRRGLPSKRSRVQDKNYNSLRSIKNLKSTMKSIAKTDRTLSTSLGFSTNKKVLIDFD